MTLKPFEGYMVIIDTDKYAGNFERDMCAFITGEIGDCGVGDEYQTMALKELDPEAKRWFEYNIGSVTDEHGCSRPVEIYETSGWFNDGYGTNWRGDADPEEVRLKRLKSVLGYYTPLIELAEKHIAKGNALYQTSLRGYKQVVKEAEMGKFPKYPAFNSVGIYFIELPPVDILTVIRSRAKKFAKARNIIVDGFRLESFTSSVKAL